MSPIREAIGRLSVRPGGPYTVIKWHRMDRVLFERYVLECQIADNSADAQQMWDDLMMDDVVEKHVDATGRTKIFIPPVPMFRQSYAAQRPTQVRF